MKKVVLIGLLLSVSVFVGCGGSSSGGGTTPTKTLVSIQITPAASSIANGATQQLTATGTYSDGTTGTLTANWLSSSLTVATINTAGLATGVGGGTTTISATSGAVTGTTTLTVVALQSITVTPAAATVAPNGMQQFTATGNYSDSSHKDLTSTAAWSATTGATITSGGLATGVKPGATATITATSGSITATASLTVTNPLASIAVTPATISLAPNATQQYTATGTYFDGSTQNITTSVTWSASTGATITSGGLATAVTANTTVTIQAAQGNIVGTAILTVTNPLVSIAVTPPNPSVAASFTQAFTATGTYADTTTQILTASVTWASSNPLVATISNIQGSQGVATGVTAGTVQITATSGSIVGSTSLTVTSATLTSIAVTPVAKQIVFQQQQQYLATGTFSDSSTQDITSTVTWTSSDTAHISITPTGIGGGLATGVATTSTAVTITATDPKSTKFGSTTATVIPPTITSIAITPTTASLAVGTVRQYTATATLNNGSTANYTSLVSWNSDNTAAATVGLHSGLVSGIAAGTANITATYNGVTSPALNLSVNAVSVQSITVTPISATMPVGVTLPFSATAVFADGTSQNISANAGWKSQNASVATLNSFGVASSLGQGTTSITASLGGVTSSPAQLAVDNSTLSTISVAPPSTVLPVGKTINYNAYGTYTDGLTFPLTNLVTWTSSAPALVSISSSSGVASTLQAGPAVTIYATPNTGPQGTASVIVTQSALTKIAVTPATAMIPVSVSTPFTAIGTFADGSTQDLTSYVTWAANPSSVATINSGLNAPGVASGQTPGQAIVTAVFAGVVNGNNPPVTLTVSTATLISISVTPSPASAPQGAQQQFHATGHFSDSSTVDLTTQVVWSSSDATVATINSSGTASVAGTSGSTAVITATFTQNVNGTLVTTSGTSTLTVQ
jgi:trimeric autotransporter adhesin